MRVEEGSSAEPLDTSDRICHSLCKSARGPSSLPVAVTVFYRAATFLPKPAISRQELLSIPAVEQIGTGKAIPVRTAPAIILVTVIVAVGAAAYRWYPHNAAMPAPAVPPAEVTVIEMRKADVPLTLVYSGRVAGFRDVEIRSQVSGIINKREFTEGARVKSGDVLFRID